MTFRPGAKSSSASRTSTRFSTRRVRSTRKIVESPEDCGEWRNGTSPQRGEPTSSRRSLGKLEATHAAPPSGRRLCRRPSEMTSRLRAEDLSVTLEKRHFRQRREQGAAVVEPHGGAVAGCEF